ncbi:MAG: hypothetical protein IPH57_11405 [Saprospiraceae bacterium]|nr:hypothetical protein [Saprospiraceae bacterium]
MKYYDQALKINPEDNITRNNIGANLMQQGKIEEAKKYFWEANKIDKNYPNTHFALGMIAEIENDLHSAFYSFNKSIKLNKHKDSLYANSVKKSFEIAQKLSSSDKGEKLIKKYCYELEARCNKKIKIIKDADIKTAAKIEIAEYHTREFHLVKYNSNYPAYEHLVMHELTHLDLVENARKEGQSGFCVLATT